MLFNSFIFLIYFTALIPIYYFAPKKAKAPLLLFSSYFFYGYWDWRFCVLLGFTTLIDYFVSRAMSAAHEDAARKRLLYVSLGANISILGFFKYFNFFIDSFSALISNFGMELDFLHLNVILPVGISFYTFKSVSYILDVYYRRSEPVTSLLDYAVYLSFFPQLVAGPIERAKNFLPQIAARSKPTIGQIQSGFLLITIGMFKKVLIGDTCGRYVDHIFAGPAYYTSPELLSALILFAVQVYADFSGYSQIAIGTAKFFGIETMENFRQPYLSANITEFWRRWHISLTTWLRDYIFLPLAFLLVRKLDALRLSEAKIKYIAYFIGMVIAMLIGGLWHGASFTFVVWGGLHGIMLAVHKIIMGKKKVAERYIYRGFSDFLLFILKVIFTFVLVLITWLFFRSPTFADAFYIIQKFVIWEGGEFTARFITVTALYLFAVISLDLIEYNTGGRAFLLNVKSAPFRYGICLGTWAVILLYMFQSQPMPFIYFQF